MENVLLNELVNKTVITCLIVFVVRELSLCILFFSPNSGIWPACFFLRVIIKL